MKPLFNSRGQIVVIVMLIMIVVSLVVLGVASRSITNLKISGTQENSARAFAAAETGVEEAIQKIKQNPTGTVSGGNTLFNGASYSYTATPVGGTGTQDYITATPLSRDTQGFQVYLSDPSTNVTTYTGTSMCIMWENTSPDASAIEANLISTTTGEHFVTNRFVYDTASVPRLANSPEMQLNPGSCQAGSGQVISTENNIGVPKTFGHVVSLSFPPGLSYKLLRIRLLFTNQSQYIGVRGIGGNLPQQGWNIDSKGTLTDGTIRRVNVFQSFAALPGIFDYVLFNGGSGALTK